MPSIRTLINANNVLPSRKLYVKRRLVDGTYETDWQRVDIVDGYDTILNWGKVSYAIDSDPSADQASFDISAITIKAKNTTGFWKKETQSGSFFYPQETYLTRQMSKIRVTCATVSSEDIELIETVMFEGFIETVTTSEDQTATIKCLSYLYILKQYSIADLGYSGGPARDVSLIVNDIVSQSKITEFFDVGDIIPKYDTEIAHPGDLQGDYWEVLQKLALLSGSVIIFSGAIGGGFVWGQFTWGETGAFWGPDIATAKQTFNFVSREPSETVAWALRGHGTGTAEVYTATNYDDEGAGRVVMRWEESGGALYSETSDVNLKLKYKIKPLSVDLELVSNSDKSSVLSTLLEIWETPKPSIVLNCRFLYNYIKVGDRVTYETLGVSNDDLPIWGQFIWGGFTWKTPKGAVLFPFGQNFYVTEVFHNIQDWTTSIRCEII
jgi:hypothetical protein